MNATVYQGGQAGTSTSVSLADLFDDSGGDCPAYGGGAFADVEPQGAPANRWDMPLQNRSGATGAWPLLSIVHCLGTPVADPGSVVVSQPDGETVSLAADELSTPSGFLAPDQAAVVLSRGSAFEFHRPQRTSGDVNGPDAVTPGNDTPIEIAVYAGPAIGVHLTQPTAPMTVPVGTQVTFTATVVGGAGSQPAWSWTSGDGQRSSDAGSATFTYRTPGTYRATVELTNADDGEGGDESPAVTVAPTGTPTPTPPPPPGSPTPGPDRGATAHSPGRTPAHGRTPGRATGRHATQSTGSGAAPGDSSGRRTRGTAAPAPTATAAPLPSVPTTATGASTRAGAGRRRPATPSRTRRTTPRTGLQRVSGRLVSDVIPLPAARSPLVRVGGGPRGTAEQKRLPVGSGSLPAVGAGLVVALLLGLGAARELDVLPRRGRLRAP